MLRTADHAAMPLAPRRSPAQYLALGVALTWGLVEFIALTRQRFTSHRAR